MTPRVRGCRSEPSGSQHAPPIARRAPPLYAASAADTGSTPSHPSERHPLPRGGGADGEFGNSWSGGKRLSRFGEGSRVDRTSGDDAASAEPSNPHEDSGRTARSASAGTRGRAGRCAPPRGFGPSSPVSMRSTLGNGRRCASRREAQESLGSCTGGNAGAKTTGSPTEQSLGVAASSRTRNDEGARASHRAAVGEGSALEGVGIVGEG
jgi:hypothetical protein